TAKHYARCSTHTLAERQHVIVDAVSRAKNHERIMDDGAQLKLAIDDVDGGEPHDLGAVGLHWKVQIGAAPIIKALDFDWPTQCSIDCLSHARFVKHALCAGPLLGGRAPPPR